MLSPRRLLPMLLVCLGSGCFACGTAIAQTPLQPTQVTLALCVDGTQTSYPCVAPPAMQPVIPSLSMFFGQILDGIATISPSGTSGTLTFSLDGGIFCTLNATGGTCPPPAGQNIPGGTHTLTASYSGDATYAPSTSNAVIVTVLPDITTESISTSRTPAPAGTPVTFTTNLTGNFVAPAGPVTFSDGATPIGTSTLSGNGGVASVAILTTSTLAVGTHTITATYAATPNFMGATASLTQVITPLASTTTSLASSLNPSLTGENVLFTASVSNGTAPIPTGTVTFLDGGVSIGTGTLSATGVATLGTSTLAAGSHNITASYGGDGANAASVSAVLVQVVNPALASGTLPFTITATPSPISVGVGLTASLLVTVTEASGYSQPVTLGCASLPTEAACTFAATTFPAGGGTTTLLISTIAPHDCGSTTPYFVGGTTGGLNRALFTVPALAGLLAWLVPGKRRRLKALIAMVAAAAMLESSGCGHCTDLGTRPGTYTIQVTGSAPGATGGNQTGTAAVVLNVKL